MQVGTGVLSTEGQESIILLSALGLIAQGVALIVWTDLGGWAAVLWILVPASSAACLLGSKAIRNRCEIVHLAVVAGFGGLAMLAGMLFGGGAGLQRAGHGFAGFWNWSTAGMLAVCIASCVCVRRRSGGKGPAREWHRNLGGLAGMLAGMALGSMWLAGPLTPALGSMFAAQHLAMVAGMTFGTFIGQRGVHLLEAVLVSNQAVAAGAAVVIQGGHLRVSHEPKGD